jgi:alpha-glucosidase (family GH31 glycosyl hydrolase)
VFGAWYQPGGSQDEQLAQVEQLRKADAPVSVAQTYLHYLPCGADRSNEPVRTQELHAQGVAVTTYFNPMLCESYTDAFRHALRTGALTRDPALEPYLYTYFTTRPFTVGQYDFSFAPGSRAFQQLLADAVADGHDGWMEDFGEYTPLDARPHDGRRNSAAHNRYVVDYHCAAWDFVRKADKPVVRFQRSGWTGAARCAQVVWGGDPTTDWGYDGLQSAVRAGLGMGLSGVGLWGSDIGGFFSFNGRKLTDELLTRWVQFGVVSGVMRTQRDGISLPSYERPQVDDPDQIANWRRYAKLRTQLQPYLAAAAEEYQRSGLPVMRHLVLAYPDDTRVMSIDDEFLFGPDILAAPVLEQGATTRLAYLPDGRWVDFWRTVAFDEESGAFHIGPLTTAMGKSNVEVPAPLDELPLFVRAGALLPLLPADVDTLADFGSGAADVVRLEDRRGERTLLAFPRGSSRARLEQGSLESRELASGWQLAIAAPNTRWTIEASLATLERPFAPCAVTWQGAPVPATRWSYDASSQVLRTVVSGSGELLARRACS